MDKYKAMHHGCPNGLSTCNEAVDLSVALGVVLSDQPPEVTVQLVLLHQLMHLRTRSLVDKADCSNRHTQLEVVHP